MTFEIVPGNAIGCRTNAHRHGWDGSICEDACDWACGIEAEFRAKYCANDINRCFHLHLFDDDEPHLVIPDSGVGWILGQDETAFDDQILLIWAPQAEEPHGIVSGRPAGSFMAGAYRVSHVERVEQRNHVEWKIHPHEDGWTFVGCLDVQAPRFMHLDGPYIKQVDGSALPQLFAAARKLGAEVDEDWSEAERDRLFHFADHIEEWLAVAEERAARFAAPTPAPRTKQAAQPSSGDVIEPAPRVKARAIPTPPKSTRPEPPSHFPLFEESRAAAIEEVYGRETLTALRTASATQPLVILRGAPGVGKSRQALEFIDDPARQRTLIVPVSASWRGRNDLLGYLNRGRNQFEPSRFTNFLRAAEKAWHAGDYSTRIVVFENFDLNPPENWLSEVLLRAAYPLDRVMDRTFDLPGDSVRGWSGDDPTHVFLSPAVRFVATLDDPVRTEALSPRLLDKAAVVRLAVRPSEALKLTGVELDEEMMGAIEALDSCTRSLCAAFNFSTAHSLKTCLDGQDGMSQGAWEALDRVLCQELLSKLELMDPGELEVQTLTALSHWIDARGAQLTHCAELIQGWCVRAGAAN